MAPADTGDGLNHRLQVEIDPSSEAPSLSWWGTAGETYFIQVAPDLGFGWQYIDAIFQGADAPLSYEFSEMGDASFFRLRSTVQPTGDPWGDNFDGDDVSNRDELLLGSDPFTFDGAGANSAAEASAAAYPVLRPGMLLRETWNNIGGFRLDHLRLAWTQLGEPDTAELQAGLEITDDSALDSYASRFRGYLIPPTQGDYQFAFTSDDQGQLWISSDANPFNKQLACYVWNYAGPEQWNKHRSQTSNLLHLEQGKPVYIEALLKEGSGLSHLKVRWKTPGSDAFVTIPPAALLSYSPHRSDRDDDLLPDRFETSIGIDSGSAHGVHGAYGDLDGDKLANLFEFETLGTDLSLADADGDGLSDYEEISKFFTDPSLADLGAATLTAEATGAEFISELGDWVVDGTTTYAREGRGSVEYAVTLPEAAIYRISLAGQSRFNQTGLSQYDIKVSVDGVYIGRLSLNGDQNETGIGTILTPWLPAGSHTVKFFVDNTYTHRSLQINGFTLNYIGGPDANENGIPDWMTHRLSVLNGFDNATPGSITESPVSPFCLIGRSRYLPLSFPADSELQLYPLPADGLYADVPLDPAAPTPVAIDFENGGIAQSTTVTWVPTNLATTAALTLRQGDSLRLTAYDAASPGIGPVAISPGDGSVDILTTEDAPVEHTFTQAGNFTLTSTTAAATHTTEVTVLEADFGDTLSLLRGNARTLTPAALAAAAEVSVDTAVLIEETTAPGAPRSFKLTASDTEPAILAARLPADGAVLDHLALAPFHLASNAEARVEVTDYYDDGAALVEVDFVLSDIPPDLRVVVRIFVGGITFDDGSIEKILTAAEFDQVGRSTLKFIMPFEAVTSVCHRIFIYNGDQFLGQQ